MRLVVHGRREMLCLRVLDIRGARLDAHLRHDVWIRDLWARTRGELRHDKRARGSTYDGSERLADRADGERHPRAELRVHVRFTPRRKEQAFHALEHPVRDRRVHCEHEPRPQPEPEARHALLRDDLARNPQERVVVRFLLLLFRLTCLQVALLGLSFSLALGTVERAADLLPGRDDRDRDGEDLGERAGDCAQCEFCRRA